MKAFIFYGLLAGAILATPARAGTSPAANPSSLESELAPDFETFNLNALQNSLSQFKQQGNFPSISVPQPINPAIEDTDHAVLPLIQSEFDRVSEMIFGNTTSFRVKSCKDDCEGAKLETDVQNKIVYISLSFFQTITAEAPDHFSVMDALDFLLAHELCHYVYERLIDLSGRHLSPSGNSSLLRDLPPSPDMSRPGWMQEQEKTMIAFSKAHAEVDALALAVLREMNGDMSVTLS